MARPLPPSEGDPVVPDVPAPDAATDTPAAELSVDELKAQADALGVTPDEGSGKDGNVLKADLVEAVENAGDVIVGRPPLAAVAESMAVIPTPLEG
jgi:hypothetical protein